MPIYEFAGKAPTIAKTAFIVLDACRRADDDRTAVTADHRPGGNVAERADRYFADDHRLRMDERGLRYGRCLSGKFIDGRGYSSQQTGLVCTGARAVAPY